MSNNPNAFSDPIACPDCGTLSPIVGHTSNSQFFFCSSCGITRMFFDFKCPVCKLNNRMFERPKTNVCFECSNCKIIVIFTEVKDVGGEFKVKYKWFSGKYKDKILEKQKQKRFGENE